MTNKNSPLRVIDQKTVNKTPPPGAQPVKYNPYTGGVIRQSTEPRYKIFLQPSSNWIKYALALYRENDRRLGQIQFAVRIPKLVIRMENPNVDIQKIKIFLSFEPDIFDNYGDDDYNKSVDPLPNIVEFSTNMVTHVGSNNRGVGNLDITSHIGRLLQRYSFYDLLIASGVDISLETYRSKTEEELKKIFEDSMYNLRVYAQAMFQQLEPDDEGTSAPYMFRMPVSCSYTLSPDQLKGADISDFKVGFVNDQFTISFYQTSIDWIELQIFDISRTTALTTSNRVLTRKINSFPDKKVDVKISVSELSDRFGQFNNFTTPLTNATSLLNFNSKYKVVITSTRSLAGVIYSGENIRKNYLIDYEYTVNVGAYNDSGEMTRKHILNLIDGQREYTLRKNNSAPISGILAIYKVVISSATRYVPRFFPISSLSSTIYAGYSWYFVKDPFTNAKLGNSFKIAFDNIVSVDFHLVSSIGRVSVSKYTYLFNKLNLTQRLETIDASVPLKLYDGHYALRFSRSNSFLMTVSRNVATGYMNAAGNFQLTANFKIVVEVRTGLGVYQNITPKSVKDIVYTLRMLSTETGMQLALTNTNSSTGLPFLNTGVTYAKGTRYRIKLVPVIPSAYSTQYTNGSFIYFLEFNA